MRLEPVPLYEDLVAFLWLIHRKRLLAGLSSLSSIDWRRYSLEFGSGQLLGLIL